MNGAPGALSRFRFAVTISRISFFTWSKASTWSKNMRHASGTPSSSLASDGSRSICRTTSYEKNPTAPAVNGGSPASRAGLCPPSARFNSAKMSPSKLRRLPPSSTVIAVPRDTIFLYGSIPMNVYRPTCSPPSTDSSKKRLRLLVCNSQERRHRRLQVRRQRAIHRDQRVLPA